MKNIKILKISESDYSQTCNEYYIKYNKNYNPNKSYIALGNKKDI